LWLNLAAYYLHVKDAEKAVSSLEQVLRIKPSHKRANQLLNQLK
jgi:Tfp pilus assembly protein PilF